MKNAWYILLFILPMLIAGCSGRGAGADLAAYDSIVYSPKYAGGFDIRAISGKQSVLLTAYTPWQNADSADSKRLLILRGDESAPKDFQGAAIADSATRIIVMSTTYIAMLDAIDRVDAVVGVSGLRFIYNQEVCANLDENADVGYEGNINYERLAALNPDLILLYGVSSPSLMEAKLKELGIPYFYFGDFVENLPLGKTEWMVAMGEIVGNRNLSEQVFSEIERRYNSVVESVNHYDVKPRVMFNLPYNDIWYMPSESSYMVQLIKDAGGSYVFTPQSTGSASEAIDLENAYLLADSADVWLNVGTITTMPELLAAVPKFADVSPVRSGSVYNNNARSSVGGGNDFYESGTVRPDIVLSDLVQILHPTDTIATLSYFIRVQ